VIVINNCILSACAARFSAVIRHHKSRTELKTAKHTG
jgi:hypothetical protein